MKELLVFCLIIAALIVGIIFADRHDAREWKRYAAEHHCVAKGTRAGQVVTGVGPNGSGGVTVTTGVQPDQTVYVCDGGEIIIR